MHVIGLVKRGRMKQDKRSYPFTDNVINTSQPWSRHSVPDFVVALLLNLFIKTSTVGSIVTRLLS